MIFMYPVLGEVPVSGQDMRFIELGEKLEYIIMVLVGIDGAPSACLSVPERDMYTQYHHLVFFVLDMLQVFFQPFHLRR